jgi:tetratricopeptide (TPR) repeat protein
MRTARLGILTLLMCWFGVVATIASEAETAFDAANRLYAQGRFSDAASAYEKLVQGGAQAPTIYFNLGNARFKAGEAGKAIAAYRQAEQLAPRDPDLRANLQFIRNQIQGPTLQSSRVQQWFSKLTVNEWTILTAVVFWIFLLLLIAVQLQPRWRSSLRFAVLLSGAATMILVACLFTFLALRSDIIAAVTSHEAIVRNGPLDESPAAFTVHDGAELKVLDTKDGWLQVGVDDRRVGWVKREQVLILPHL